jgi:hypothetical protein
MLHSADIVDDNRRQREAIEHSLGQGSVPGAQYGATFRAMQGKNGCHLLVFPRQMREALGNR